MEFDETKQLICELLMEFGCVGFGFPAWLLFCFLAVVHLVYHVMEMEEIGDYILCFGLRLDYHVA
jgi:hypothetical protein